MTALPHFANLGASNWLISLYDRITGGSLSRGSVFALGIVPYVSARIFVWLGQRSVASIASLQTSRAGRRTLTWWTRGLTVGISVVQSIGLVRLTDRIAATGAHSSFAFLVQTTALLTAGAVAMMLMAEQVAHPDELEETDAASATHEAELDLLAPGDDLGALGLATLRRDAGRAQASRPDPVVTPL